MTTHHVHAVEGPGVLATRISQLDARIEALKAEVARRAARAPNWWNGGPDVVSSFTSPKLEALTNERLRLQLALDEFTSGRRLPPDENRH